MTMNNPDYDRAWASVPGVAHCERQLKAVRERRDAMSGTLSPNDARRAVIGEAVRAMLDGAELPDDIGTRAADAYRAALEAESEWIALSEAETSLGNHLNYLRETEAETALEELGTALAEFLADVRKTVPDLKGATSAEGAIEQGGKAPAAWKTLTDMVGRLRSIRDAQYRTLRPLGDGYRLQRLREAGHFELAGLQPGDVPDAIMRAIARGHYDVPYLIFLANSAQAWVPTSFEALEAEDIVDVGVPDGPLADYNPREEIIPEPPAPKPTGAERQPVLSY
ncbi:MULTISPECIES: hypothetical protein [unclassified Streptomyces]|uniref:hypothetical protein n=1 Tax=unclassified Streptomyces TaxID=2593676 RepID=UPI0036B0E1F5